MARLAFGDMDVVQLCAGDKITAYAPPDRWPPGGGEGQEGKGGGGGGGGTSSLPRALLAAWVVPWGHIVLVGAKIGSGFCGPRRSNQVLRDAISKTR